MDRRIMLVDDEQDVLDVLSMTLRSRGYEPFATTNAAEALDVAARDGYRVFIIDLRMPRMDGMELCRRIKAANPNAYVCALSACVSAYSEAQFLANGFDDYLTKPFDLRGLFAVCEEACHREGA
jgi:DNA-binding response OmpR family regulator